MTRVFCFAGLVRMYIYILYTQVSPANSFGFMDGGIDMAYSLHFGWQMYVVT